jgi:hypothetical protein
VKECWVVWFDAPVDDSNCMYNSHICSVHLTEESAQKAKNLEKSKRPYIGGEFLITKMSLNDN